ncbi:DENN domain-containing protein 2B-like isoform X2 [Zophobas morio]|uniref:DENN domain-containing protein 2B-like isoform X2 n=1 Tax=Zophobas morio TaxID=2755281 RepID=UPI00308299D9
MYRPPENSNRVKSIKTRFENVEPSKPNVPKRDLNANNNNSAAATWVVQNLTRQLSDPARKNIKRSPAFRIDINPEKGNSFERSTACNRSFYFERLQQYNTALKSNDGRKTAVIKTDKLDCRKNEQGNQCAKLPPLVKSKSSLDFTLIRRKFEKNDDLKENVTNENIPDVKDPCFYTKPIPKALRHKDTTTIVRNDGIEISNDLDKEDINKSTEVEESVGLTDTLKAALKRPLPPGPAPQKPPRTFEHTPVKEDTKNVSFLHNHQKNQHQVVKNTKKVYKHDPRYMLNKLETALRNNKLRTKKPVKLEASTTSGEDSDDSVLYKSKSQKPFSPIPDTPSDDNPFNFNCFNGLTCHSTYEKIREPNSAFFVNCAPEPVYAEPFDFSRASNTEALKNIRNEEKSTENLYYLSTPLLCEEENNGCLNMDGNLNNQVSGDNSSTSSGTSLDMGAPGATDSSESPSKIKHLINAFETKQTPTTSKKDNQVASDGSHRIEELKLSLQRTLERTFDSDTKEWNEQKSIEKPSTPVDFMINKFQTYVKTMPKYQKPKLNKDNQLFYCCLVVGWSDKPKIKFRYPANVKIPHRIEDLCYPEVASGPLDISDNAQCYTLVITNDKGERTFGYCRRVIPEGSTKCIPLAYCLLSKHRAPRFYKKILTELESRHGIPDKLRDELISKFYHNKFPRPGESVKLDLSDFTNEVPKNSHLQVQNNRDSCDLSTFVQVNVNGGYVEESAKTTELTVTLHHDTRYEEADLKPLHKLPSHILLKIFASLLLERKVILISCVISKLSTCVDALQSILYPFSWPHTFIPILPQCLWEVVESPTPVICGILSVSVVNDHKIEDGIVVDLDECSIISEEGDEDSILSDSMKKAWNEGYTLANKIPPNEYVHSVYLSDAYVKVFIVALKHYRSHIVGDGFDKENFIKSAKSKGIRRFLKWFTETTMFTSFIDSVISSTECFNSFDRKIEMYGSDESNKILSRLRDWKKN